MVWLIPLVLSMSVLGDLGQEVEGSGEGEGAGLAHSSTDQTPLTNEQVVNLLLYKFDPYEHVPINLSLQIEPVSAVNELFRGQIELTLWIREEWTDQRLDFSEISGAETISSIVLPVNEEMSDKIRLDTLISSATYFKIPRSPIAHGKVLLQPNGTVTSYLKITINLPCQPEYQLNSDPNQRYINQRKWVHRCTFRYRSYTRNSSVLGLDWHFPAVRKQNIPCVTQGGRGSGACDLVQITTFGRQKDFFGQIYDELEAHLRFRKLN